MAAQEGLLGWDIQEHGQRVTVEARFQNLGKKKTFYINICNSKLLQCLAGFLTKFILDLL